MFSLSTVYLREREVMSLAASRGLGVELQGFAYPEYYGSGYAARAAADLAATGARARSIHGPFMDLSPASVDPEIVAVARMRCESALADCRAVGARALVFHSGWIPKTYSDEAWLGRAVPFWKGLLALADGLLLRIENVFEDDWRLLSRLADEVDDPRLGICLDLGHVNANSTRSAPEWIRGLGSRIAHTHLHNNSGGGDDHAGLADGTLDMEEALGLLAELCPAAAWNIEAKRDLEASVDFLLGFLERSGLGPDFG